MKDSDSGSQNYQVSEVKFVPKIVVQGKQFENPNNSEIEKGFRHSDRWWTESGLFEYDEKADK